MIPGAQERLRVIPDRDRTAAAILTRVARLVELLHRLVDGLDLALVVDLRADVLARLEALQLVLQLQIALEAVRRERALFDRLLHRAARLVAMAAIGEVAACGELYDVVEGLARAFGLRPQLQLAHARRVDQQAAAVRQQDQVAMARGVAAA